MYDYTLSIPPAIMLLCCGLRGLGVTDGEARREAGVAVRGLFAEGWSARARFRVNTSSILVSSTSAFAPWPRHTAEHE